MVELCHFIPTFPTVSAFLCFRVVMETTEPTAAVPSASRCLITYSRKRRGRKSNLQPTLLLSLPEESHTQHCLEVSRTQSSVKIEPVTPEKVLPRRAREQSNETTGIGEQKFFLHTYARRRETRPADNDEDDDKGGSRISRAEVQRLRARVHSFIARMQGIQGDRKFSQWKGSVMDSVVGAFLAQNVSDTSSSFAFMSLVAKFPLKANDTEYITIEPKMGINDGMSGYWDKLREEAYLNGYKLQRNDENRDSANWEAVRCTTANEISKVIKQRGQHRRLAIRIKDFLDRIVKHHGHLDLEWLRYVAPDKAKEFLLSIRGLGQKSVECIGLLALNHLAFPVDTNVDRISTRLGWVCPLPDDNLKHFPKPNSIQKCLWSYLCELDQQTLYELHYQMITFGKVFCTKRNPNCSVCPMKEECKYFESAREGNALLRASRKGSNSSTVCAIEENDIEDNFHEALYEHYVYELPDLHPLLEALDPREPNDPCPYLLNVTLPETCSEIKENYKQCGSNHEEQGPIGKGTFLIPVRTAMKGRFPLNGTYFQVNEVFADDQTSYSPIDVPWKLICNLPKRILHIGSSTMALLKEKSIGNIIACFNTGFICTRGFDRRTRYPKPICERLRSMGREASIKNPRRRGKKSR